MLTSIVRWWRHRQRKADLRYLWPACKNRTSDIMEARSIFFMHALNDHAYSDMSTDEIFEYVSKLE